jgi:hypothetical protein
MNETKKEQIKLMDIDIRDYVTKLTEEDIFNIKLKANSKRTLKLNM